MTRYRIAREELAQFIAAQVVLVEREPVPQVVADAAELRTRAGDLAAGDVEAVWLGAGLATHVGLAIFEQPERFIETYEPVRLAA